MSQKRPARRCTFTLCLPDLYIYYCSPLLYILYRVPPPPRVEEDAGAEQGAGWRGPPGPLPPLVAAPSRHPCRLFFTVCSSSFFFCPLLSSHKARELREYRRRCSNRSVVVWAGIPAAPRSSVYALNVADVPGRFRVVECPAVPECPTGHLWESKNCPK